MKQQRIEVMVIGGLGCYILGQIAYLVNFDSTKFLEWCVSVQGDVVKIYYHEENNGEVLANVELLIDFAKRNGAVYLVASKLPPFLCEDEGMCVVDPCDLCTHDMNCFAIHST